jgi:hypothetical protein
MPASVFLPMAGLPDSAPAGFALMIMGVGGGGMLGRGMVEGTWRTR